MVRMGSGTVIHLDEALEPADEAELLATAGLALTARVDREPYLDSEHPSRRCYLMVKRP